MKHILLALTLISPFLLNAQTTNTPYKTMLNKRTEILTGKKATPQDPQSLPALTQEVDTFTTQLEELSAQLKTL